MKLLTASASAGTLSVTVGLSVSDRPHVDDEPRVRDLDVPGAPFLSPLLRTRPPKTVS